MNINNLIRKNLKTFSAYTPGEQPSGDDWIKLNTNENPFPILPGIIKDLKNALNNNLRKYPDPMGLEVRKAIVTQLLKGEDTLSNINCVFIGNGSDDTLDVIFKLFVDPQDEVVFFKPSYGMYKSLAEQYDAKIKEINLTDDFNIPNEAYSITGKLFIISSPNNPNGKAFENEKILKICKSFSGIVVVDAAYADFSDKNAFPLLKDAKNLIVLRTFSKSFALASLRFGYALADPNIIEGMNKVKLPYNVNYMAQVAALSCIRHKYEIIEQNKKIIAERERLINELRKIKEIQVHPSDANFILVDLKDQQKAHKMFLGLKKNKILVRYFDKSGLRNYLRISIGTKEQDDKLIMSFRNNVNA